MFKNHSAWVNPETGICEAVYGTMHQVDLPDFVEIEPENKVEYLGKFYYKGNGEPKKKWYERIYNEYEEVEVTDENGNTVFDSDGKAKKEKKPKKEKGWKDKEWKPNHKE